MKKILFLVLCCSSISFAQKELWTVVKYGNTLNFWGNIVKFDMNAMNGEILHTFDEINGRYPVNKLLQASNGKIYGVTEYGGLQGTPGTSAAGGQGLVYEYDPILNKYRVVHYFTQAEIAGQRKGTGLIEPVQGILYGSVAASIYYININTGAFNFCTGYAGNLITGKLMKASNGYLYGTVSNINNCPMLTSINSYNEGGIFKVNLTTNTVSAIYEFKCNQTDGLDPRNGLIEITPGKLYGIAQEGGEFPVGNYLYYGTLFEFDINTNVFTKKVTFDNTNLGRYPHDLIDAGNGKLLGTCIEGGAGVNLLGEPSAWGTIFEYSPATNIIIKKFDCFAELNYTNASTQGPNSLTKLSNNTIVGLGFGNTSNNERGYPFFYNQTANTIFNPLYQIQEPVYTDLLYNKTPSEAFIEICRKPSYQEILINTFTPAVGTTFTYNVQNTNATTYVWKRGTTVLPLQTTGTLTLTNVTTNDTGVYTCNMTNECGTTVTANLNVTVTNLATETVDTYKSEIALYPNPTKSTINLKFPENRGLKGIQYKITNLLGQVVQEAAIVADKSHVTIDSSAFPVGVYQVTLTTDKGDWNGKFVRE